MAACRSRSRRISISCDSDAADWCARLRERLLTPAGSVSFLDLAAHWRHATVIVESELPPGFDDGAGLAARLRGALGWALRDRLADPRRSPPAYHVLWGDHGDWRPNVPVPRPYALAADGSGARLVIRLSLFGFATAWVTPVREALLAALEGGINLDGRTRVRARLRPERLTVERHERIEIPPVPAEALLRFDIPLKVRRGDALLTSGPALLGSLGFRLGGFARWNDLQVVDDFNALSRSIHRLQIDDAGMRPVPTWERHSHRSGDRAIPMHGLDGRLFLRGDLSRLWPLLVLGRTCHIGSEAALGLGRYGLAPLP